ncbi:hypothetical protein Tco_0541286 [Tanacetum coccineum]
MDSPSREVNFPNSQIDWSCNLLLVACVHTASTAAMSTVCKLAIHQNSLVNLLGNPTSTILKCRNRRRSIQRVEPFSLVETLVVTMADQRTMAELLRATTDGYAEAIVEPPIPAEHFELKHSLINLVTSKKFFGFEKEDPHAHIGYFNKITSTLKYKDVPESSIKLMLFPFSIDGPAWIWLDKKNLPHLSHLGCSLFPSLLPFLSSSKNNKSPE